MGAESASFSLLSFTPARVEPCTVTGVDVSILARKTACNTAFDANAKAPTHAWMLKHTPCGMHAARQLAF